MPAINLVGVHHAEIIRGHELATPGYLEATRVLTVDLALRRDAGRPLKHRDRYKLHLGTAEVSAVLSLLERAEPSRASPASRSSCWPSPSWLCMVNRSCCASRARPLRLAAAACIGPSLRRLSGTDHAIDRPARAPPLARSRPLAFAAPSHLSALNAWTERRIVRVAGLSAGYRGIITSPHWRPRAVLVDLPVGPRARYGCSTNRSRPGR